MQLKKGFGEPMFCSWLNQLPVLPKFLPRSLASVWTGGLAISSAEPRSDQSPEGVGQVIPNQEMSNL